MRNDRCLAKCAKTWFFIAVTVSFTAVFYNTKELGFNTEKQRISSRSISLVRGATLGDEAACGHPPCDRSHKQGLDIIYKPLISCAKPKFLANYTNPCWNSTGKVTCAAKVMLLGFPNCGTSDMNEWFSQHNQANSVTADYFYAEGLYTKCPNNWIDEYVRDNRSAVDKSKMGYVSCTNCALLSRTVTFTSTYILRQSAIQYLQYTMVERSRYLISMRNPSQRMISDYFHNLNKSEVLYEESKMTEGDYFFFHNNTSTTVTTLTNCLEKHGTTECILEPDLSKFGQHELLTHAITTGCYSTHLKELFKFIPMEIVYFSKLEEYSANEADAMSKIYEFLGLPLSGIEGAIQSNMGTTKKNKRPGSRSVLPETERILNEFYRPFNVELAALLGDKKWLWS